MGFFGNVVFNKYGLGGRICFSDILIPALFIGGLGLIFGALLGYASIKFKVDKNENIDKVAELLPGANCGGCGFTGCSALAEAIVENGEKSRGAIL
ncbi:MAG: hypothetical protein L6V93_10180 [Clostridiales bacterium]|nr:MAG: hypothetical protein L6V93_10180 [Clostridiales bacterium]